MNDETRGIEVRQSRKAQGMRQEDLAEAAGVAVRTIRNIEAGKHVAPATATMIYHALGISGATPVWPAEVEAFLQMVGYRLTSVSDEKRWQLIHEMTRQLIAGPTPSG